MKFLRTPSSDDYKLAKCQDNVLLLYFLYQTSITTADSLLFQGPFNMDIRAPPSAPPLSPTGGVFPMPPSSPGLFSPVPSEAAAKLGYGGVGDGLFYDPSLCMTPTPPPPPPPGLMASPVPHLSTGGGQPPYQFFNSLTDISTISGVSEEHFSYIFARTLR